MYVITKTVRSTPHLMNRYTTTAHEIFDGTRKDAMVRVRLLNEKARTAYYNLSDKMKVVK
jgi:hypothetical protein